MMMLALDLSTKSTGYAIFKDKELVTRGLIKTSSTSMIKRVLYVSQELKKIIEEYEIDKIIAEEVLPESAGRGNSKTFKALMYMQAAVEFLVYGIDKEISIEYIYPNSWRSKCGIKTGRGATREGLKQEDIRFAETTYKLEGLTDDEADAIGIGHSYFIEERKDEINW